MSPISAARSSCPPSPHHQPSACRHPRRRAAAPSGDGGAGGKTAMVCAVCLCRWVPARVFCVRDGGNSGRWAAGRALTGVSRSWPSARSCARRGAPAGPSPQVLTSGEPAAAAASSAASISTGAPKRRGPWPGPQVRGHARVPRGGSLAGPSGRRGERTGGQRGNIRGAAHRRRGLGPARRRGRGRTRRR